MNLLNKNLNKDKCKLFIMMWLYSLSLMLYFILSRNIVHSIVFPNDFSFLRFMNSFFWYNTFLLLINIEERKAIPYFLLLTLWVQIIPVGVVYTFCGGSSLLYNIINIGFCFVVVFSYLKPIPNISFFDFITNKKILLFIIFSVFVLLGIIYYYNGLPTLIALNIYNVYELRTNGIFVLHRYLHRFMGVAVSLLIPFLLSHLKRWNNFISLIGFLLCCIIVFILYLYTGYKVYIFGLAVNLFCLFLSKINKFTYKIFCFLSVFMIVLSFFSLMNNKIGDCFSNVFSLIGRRALLAPARIVFLYDDYFEKNETYGLYGLLPQVFFPYRNSFANDETIGKKIGFLYFKESSMDVSTGQLGNSIFHFGRFGIIISWFTYLIIIKLLELLEKKAGFNIVVGSFSFYIYFLTDTPLISSFISSSGLAIFLLAFIYKKETNISKRS